MVEKDGLIAEAFSRLLWKKLIKLSVWGKIERIWGFQE